MNRFFGAPWPSGVCDDGTQVSTPVGATCLWCEEAIEAGDRGVLLLHVGADANLVEVAQHRECILREVAGGIGHRTDCAFWCKCMNDPDAGLSRRESARRVWTQVMGS